MADSNSFRQAVQQILKRRRNTMLPARWDDARSVDPDPMPQAWWIRETDDLVNIVWLTRQGVLDVTWLPGSGTGIFNYVPLSSIENLELRQAPNLADQMGLAVSGDLVVKLSGAGPGLVWVASSDPANVDELRAFMTAVLKRIA